ncbi:MAG TPA: DUF448 domain-containing protein [Acidimicrobiia bacterium]|nr:DUF448 domain-containing protein [Acidimicrobiia bacterium]
MGCRRVADASELVRVFVAADGGPDVGPGPGRGAWLCRPPGTIRCLDDAQRRRALDRALRVSISASQLARLRAKLERLNG